MRKAKTVKIKLNGYGYQTQYKKSEGKAIYTIVSPIQKTAFVVVKFLGKGEISVTNGQSYEYCTRVKIYWDENSGKVVADCYDSGHKVQLSEIEE